MKPAGDGPWTRIIVEKPFGRDLDSAQALDRELHAVFDERQIHRIDHYLGKETVQNLLLLRFTNGLFEPIWNRRYVDHVQILVAETLGVEGRGAYYDTSGARARHAAEPHDAAPLPGRHGAAHLVLGREGAQREGEGAARHQADDGRRDRAASPSAGSTDRAPSTAKPCRGYREEPDVHPDSTTDTFAAARFEVENWRWAGVPFYLRTGKRLPMRDTEITIEFRRAPLLLLPGAQQQPPNRLVIHVQPDERIALHFHAKCPGPQVRARAGGDVRSPTATSQGESRSTGYETLLYDCMVGDATLVPPRRHDRCRLARRRRPSSTPGRRIRPRDFPNYAAGTWGPECAEQLIARDGRAWVAAAGDG